MLDLSVFISNCICRLKESCKISKIKIKEMLISHYWDPKMLLRSMTNNKSQILQNKKLILKQLLRKIKLCFREDFKNLKLRIWKKNWENKETKTKNKNIKSWMSLNKQSQMYLLMRERLNREKWDSLKQKQT